MRTHCPGRCANILKVRHAWKGKRREGERLRRDGRTEGQSDEGNHRKILFLRGDTLTTREYSERPSNSLSRRRSEQPRAKRWTRRTRGAHHEKTTHTKEPLKAIGCPSSQPLPLGLTSVTLKKEATASSKDPEGSKNKTKGAGTTGTEEKSEQETKRTETPTA